MTLVPEDGSIVADANTFVTVDFVSAYLQDRNLDETWAALSQPEQEAAILRGADWLKNEDRLKYRGVRISIDQTMPWPREGAVEYRGPAIPDDVIPWRLMHAQAELAFRSLSAEVQPDLDRGGKIISDTTDVLSTTWADDAPVETLYPAVMGLLAPLLLSTTLLRETPYHAAPAVLYPFADSDFRFS